MPIRKIKKHARSYKYATQGILHTLRTQSNIWIQIPCGVAILLAAWYFKVERWEWFVLVLTIGQVISAELFNTSIEVMMNLIHRKYDLDVKIAKDVAAGAVLVSVLAAVVIGILIFAPRLFSLV